METNFFLPHVLLRKTLSTLWKEIKKNTKWLRKIEVYLSPTGSWKLLFLINWRLCSGWIKGVPIALVLGSSVSNSGHPRSRLHCIRPLRKKEREQVPASQLLSCDDSILWKGSQSTWWSVSRLCHLVVFQFCFSFLVRVASHHCLGTFEGIPSDGDVLVVTGFFGFWCKTILLSDLILVPHFLLTHLGTSLSQLDLTCPSSPWPSFWLPW